MRADEGKSVQEMEFLAPVTPAKPMVLGQRQIYQNGQEILSNQGSLGEAGAYRAQVSLVSKMGGTNHYQAGIGGEANQADRWTPLYSATTQLSGSTSDNNSVHGSLPFGCGYDTSQEMNAAPKVKESDPFTQWNHMPFCDLLAMNNGGAPAVLGGSMNPLISNDFFVNLNPQTSFMFENQGIMGGVENILVEPNKTSRDLQGSNQQLNERIEIQQSGYSRNSWNSYDLNALPNAENELQYDDRYADIVNAVPDGGIHVFAPETPDHFKILGNDAPGNIAFPADKQPSKQGENDNQVSIPVVDNWLGISEIRSPANSIAIERHSPEKGGELDLEQNKTPQPKARRKKHRPKVVREVKPKQTPTQKQPKASNTNETPTTQKRKYVRKNKTKTPSTTSPIREGLSSKVPDRVVRSCRKTLNFDLEDQVKESNSSHRSSDAPSSEQLPLNQEGKDEMEATREYDAYDISVRNNQILKDYMSMPEGRARDVSQATFPLYESNAAREYERGIKRDRQTSTSSKRNSAETCASSIGGEQTRGAKRANLSLGDASNMARGSFTSQGTPSEVNHMYLRSAILNGIHGMYFPEIFKKRRTEKVLKPNTLSCASTSKYYYLNPAPHFNVTAEPSNQATTTFHSHEDKTHFINWANIDKLKQKKKRSKVPTRVRELDSLKGFAECRRSTSKQKVKRTGKKNVEKFSHRSRMEVLPLVSSANRTGKRQSRKRSTKVKSVTSSYDLVNKLSLELHKDEQLTGNANGPFLALPWKDTFSVDAIIEGMEQLNINKQGSSSVRFKDQNILVPYHFKKHFQNQQQNALVLYQRDRSMIPFEGTQASKRRSRARVDLDDETSRVWKLLLEDINSQGIDGTDEEKAKWWENERKVFCGRVDSFIARMRLVQGDRHFSPWKGSVVDSVVGVFLTQNVSDHLSSSAFMSVAARFPVNPTDKFRMHPEEEIGPLVEEPESFIVDLNDNGESLEWNEKTVAVPSCDRNSRTLHDTDVSEESHGSTNLKDETWCCFNSSQEKPHESILYRASSISKESEIVSASADARRIDDVSSSQLSVISCQNSVESPNALMGSNISSGEDMTACSKPSSLNCSGSFVELLRMAGTPKLDATYVSKDQMPSYKSDVPNEEGIKDEHIKKPDTTQMLESFSNVQSKCSTVYELHATEGYVLQGVDEESRSVSSTKSSQDFTTEQIKATESTSECLLQEKASESNLMSSPIVDNVCSCYVLEGEDMIILTPRQPVETQQDMIIQTPRQPIEIQQDTIIQTPRQPVEMQQDTIIQTPRQPVEMQQDTIIQTPRQPVEMQQDTIIQTPRQPVEMQQDTIIQTPRQPVEMQQDTIIQTPRQPVEMPQDMIVPTPAHPVEMQQDINSQTEGSENSPKRNPNLPALSGETGVTESTCASNITVHNEFTPNPPLSGHNHTSGETHHAVRKDTLQQKTRKAPKKASYDWENLRKEAQVNGKSRQQTANTMDSVDWEAVRRADVNEVAKTIKERGMNNVLAERIKEFLDRIVNDHGSIDLEWLRDVPPDKAKEYLLSIRGLGLKSVECVRLLTLHQLAFPVDTNVGRIAVRLGWVPLQPLPESLQLHLLELYPILESIQKYLWPRLCKLDQKTLYELHYHLITFGKVFCTKKQPNCNACPLRGECRHFASAFASARLALPAPEDKRIVPSYEDNVIPQVLEDKRIIPSYEDNAIPQVAIQSLPMPLLMADPISETKSESRNSEPIVEIPASPEAEPEQLQTLEYDIEDALDEDPNEIPTIKLNLEQFTNTLQTYMQSNMELQDGEMSTALVSLATEAASIPTPRLKNVNRLRTEHHVYELPDTHQLLRGLDKREPDDPCSYLLAIWTPGETANSIEAPEKKCHSQEPGELCGDETCFYCNSQREANSQIVRGTLLIPCRTAMRGSFPLNGTYFQVNEVFADHDSSLNPIEVPRQWIWNLPRRTVYFGTSIPSIFKGLSTEGIQHCFWRGYVCVRGFEQKTRSPRPLMARLHFPASKLARPRGRNSEQDV